MRFIEGLVRLYYSGLIRTVLHNNLYFLEKELKGCRSVLDLGCGDSSLLRYLKIGFSVGVDCFFPYLLESRKRSIHDFYIMADIREIEFKPSSFDAVLLLNVIEHLKKEDGLSLLLKAIRVARKKVIVITPNGYLKQVVISDNPFQEHLSGWKPQELKELGFKANGLGGFKFFRTDTHREDPYNYLERTLSTIRFKPRPFWLILGELSQVFAHYFPSLCLEVFYVKKV